MPLSTNAEGYALLRRFEGLRLEAYLCPAGVPTIGYGHTDHVRPGLRITKEQAEVWLHTDVEASEKHIHRLVTIVLNSNQFSALVCFAFNVGAAALARSTLLSLLNRGWYEQVPVQMLRWIRAGGRESEGLCARRLAEAALWNTPVGPDI